MQAFTPNQVNVLEYWSDLEDYYQVGHGSPLNKNVACEAVSDMMHHMESNSLPKVVAYFTHSQTVQLLLTALGTAQDSDALRADNYLSMTRRKWRSSQMAPFAANLAAVKYECPQDVEQTKVMFFLNEKPIDFSWCKVGLCNWSDVKEKYKSYSQGDCASTYCTGSASAIKHIGLLSVLLPCIGLLTYFH